MSTGFAISDLLDITQGTYPYLQKPTWELIAQEEQRYIVMPMLFKFAESVVGESLEFKAQFTLPDNASHTGLFDTDTLAMEDNLVTGNIRWSMAKAGWAWDQRAKALNAAGSTQIVDLYKKERVSAVLQLVEKLENPLFQLLGTSDNLSPFGLPYFFPTNATEGFNGGHPSGFSDVAGISRTTYANWKNYTFRYDDWTKDDLIRKMRKAFLLMDWRSPKGGGSEGYKFPSKGRDRIYLVGVDFYLRMAELVEAGNQNIGAELAAFDGNAVFRGVPFVYTPVMDTEFTDDRIYMLDLRKFGVKFKKGWELKETPPFMSRSSHNVLESWFDVMYAFICTDCRTQAVGYKS